MGCLNCEKRFTISMVAYETGRGFFHNRKCAAEFRQKQKKIKASYTINKVEFPKSEKDNIKRLVERAAALRESIQDDIPKQPPQAS